MVDWDEVLGSQQDQIAEGQQKLNQLTDTTPSFNGCETPFDVFRRGYQADGPDATRSSLVKVLNTLYPQMQDAAVWAERLMRPLASGNATEFGEVMGRASVTAAFGC